MDKENLYFFYKYMEKRIRKQICVFKSLHHEDKLYFLKIWKINIYIYVNMNHSS